MANHAPFFSQGPAADGEYLAARDHPVSTMRDTRHRIELIWQECAPFLDPDLPRRARDEFHSAFWELHLCSTLRQARAPLVTRAERGMRNTGPDLVARPRVWVEAVAAKNGRGPDAVPDDEIPESKIVARSVPDDQITLRLTAALDEKVRQIERWADAGLVHEDDIIILAVNDGAVPDARTDRDPPRIVRAVYPLGHEQFHFDLVQNEIVGRSLAYRPSIQKKSGAHVQTSLFDDDRSRRISAIAYCATTAMDVGWPDAAPIILVHNRSAATPLPLGSFPCVAEYWIDGDQPRREDGASRWTQPR